MSKPQRAVPACRPSPRRLPVSHPAPNRRPTILTALACFGVLAIAVSLGAAGNPVHAAPGDADTLIDYQLVDTWTDEPWSLKPGHFGAITDVSSGPDSTVYVLDAEHRAVHAIDPDGTARSVFRLPDHHADERWVPRRLDVGVDGVSNVLGDVRGGHSVDRVSPDGTPLGRFATVAPDDDARLVTDIAAAPSGHLFVSRSDSTMVDYTPGVLDVYATDGTLVESVRSGDLHHPDYLDIGADGAVHVVNVIYTCTDQSCASRGQALVLDANHMPIRTIDLTTLGDIAVGPTGIYVGSLYQARVFRAGETEPMLSTENTISSVQTLSVDVAPDGRLHVGAHNTYAKLMWGLLTIDDPTAGSPVVRSMGSHDRAPHGGPANPARLDSGSDVAVLQRRYSDWEGPRREVDGIGQSGGDAPEVVQHWTQAGVPIRQHLSEHGAIDVATDGDDTYLLTRKYVHRWSGETYPERIHEMWEGCNALPLHFDALAADNWDIALLDVGNQRVEIMSRLGVSQAVWPVSGRGAASLAVDVAFERERVFLADWGRSAVMVRDTRGLDRGEFPTHDRPKHIATSPSGEVYVLSETGWLMRYDRDGDLRAWWPVPDRDLVASGTAERWIEVRDVAADEHERVYVTWAEKRMGTRRSRETAFIDRAGVWVFAPTGDSRVPVMPAGACIAWPDKTAEPERLPLGDAVDVIGRISGYCPGRSAPSRIMIAFDNSQDTELRKHVVNGYTLFRLSRSLAAELLAAVDSRVSATGLVTVEDAGTVIVPLTEGTARTWQAVTDLKPLSDDHSLASAVALAHDEMTRPGRPQLGKPVIWVVSDGDLDDATHDAIERARADGIECHLLLFTPRDFDWDLYPDLVALFGGEDYVVADLDPARDLAGAWRLISYTPQPRLFEAVSVTDALHEMLPYVADSAVPAATETGGRLTWQLSGVLAEAGVTLTHQLRARAVGRYPVSVGAVARYHDAWGYDGTLEFPEPEVEVVAPPTATATASPTASPTPRPTATPEITPPVPQVAYLPYAARYGCLGFRLSLDLALVLDTSTSMEAPTGTGAQAKLDAAVAAAGGLVDRLAPGRDRVAVVAFNEEAYVVSRLTDDLSAVRAVMGGLPTARGTRIDRGLDTARLVLGEGYRSNARAVVILLTDGIQSGPGESVDAAAGRLRANGTIVFAIGLGGDVDSALLARTASSPDRYYASPEASDLDSIYRRISRRLVCGKP